MKAEQFIAILPAYLQANPTAFSDAALADLDVVLNNLDQPDSVDQTRAAFVQWLRTYTTERDQLEAYAASCAADNREVGQQAPNPAIAEATTLQNRFEEARNRRRSQAPSPDKPPKA